MQLPRKKAHAPGPEEPRNSVRWLWYLGYQFKPADAAMVFMTKLLYFLRSDPHQHFSAATVAAASGAVASGLIPHFENARVEGLIDVVKPGGQYPVYKLSDEAHPLMERLLTDPYSHLK